MQHAELHKQRIKDAQHQMAKAKTELQAAVDLARQADATWADIGNVLGVSRQAAWERFGKKQGAPAPEDVCQHCGSDLSPDKVCGWCG